MDKKQTELNEVFKLFSADDNEKEFLSFIADLSLSEDIKISDMPNIDLYMEQLTSFIDNKMGHLKRDPNDKVLTNTMINNYIKDGILMQPKNKKYGQEHLMMLILIYNLKQVLSIKDIKSLFEYILKDINKPGDDVLSPETIYSVFLELKSLQMDKISTSFNKEFEMIREKTSKLTERKYTSEAFLFVLILIAQANAYKRVAEKIIDVYFKERFKE